MKRLGCIAAVWAVVVLAGCASGPLGSRPEVINPGYVDPADQFETLVPLTFDLRDEDLTTCSVTVEYSTDGGATWHYATIVSSSAGAVTGKGTVSGLRPLADFSRVTVLWDTWADGVGDAGDDNVLLRITPSDADGVGVPVASTAPFVVNNHFARLGIQQSTVAFQHGLANTSNPADKSFTIENTGNADLSWQITGISYLPVVTPWIATTPALLDPPVTTVPGDTSVVAVSADPNGAGLGEGAYTAEITVEDPAADGSPRTVTVTLTVSRPIMRVEPASVTFQEGVVDYSSPGNESFLIYNDGPAYTELHWMIDTSGFPLWLDVVGVSSGSIDGGGGPYAVQLSADHTGQTVGPHTHTLTVEDSETPDVATIVSQDVFVTFPIRNQRPEILIHDGTGTPFPADALALACVEGTATSDYFSIRNAGEPVSELDWDLTEGAGWLSCSPVSNAGPALAFGADEAVTVDVTTATLSPVPGVTDDYTATITVTGGDYTLGEPTVSGVDRQLVVELDVLKQSQIDPSPAGVVFPDGVWGDAYPIPSDVVVDIYNITGEVDLDWTGNWYLGVPDWVTVSAALPASGQVDMGGSDSDTLTFTLDADAASLGIGDHAATFRFVNQYGTPTDLPVSFHVGYRDLIVESIALNPAVPTPSQGVTFTATVRNLGDAAAGACDVGLWLDRGAAPGIADAADYTTGVGPVAAGGTAQVQFTMAAPAVEGSYTAWAYADHGTSQVAESNEGNNAGPSGGKAWDVVLPLLFVEDFEDGDYNGWTIGSGSYVRQVTTATAAAGTNRSLTLIGGGGHYDGISRSFPNLTPSRITFYVRSSDASAHDGYFVFGTGPNISSQVVFFYMRGTGSMGIVSGSTYGVPYVADTWYKISFQIDWAAREVDYYVNDVLQYSNIAFRAPSVGSISDLYLYNYSNSQAWWDEIRFYP